MSGSLIRPVILSGGVGARLWPISRPEYPKQFAPLINDMSLFAETLKRVSERSIYAAPIIVGNKEHKFLILDALDRVGINDAIILLEPVSRNTGAAAISSAIYDIEADLLHLVMPSDHLIENKSDFHKSVKQAAKVAKNNIILFGIKPQYPATGFGYIVPDKSINNKIYRNKLFIEKPNQEVASDLIAQGAFWNSGMFLYHPKTLCDNARELETNHYEQCHLAIDSAKKDKFFSGITILEESDYAKMESHSFDILIMEKAKNGAVMPCSFGWSDVGSWQSIKDASEQDANENVLIGDVVVRDVKNSYIRSEWQRLSVIGMDSCMVVAAKDSILVAPLERSQEVKELSNDNNKNMSITPKPWGNYEGVTRGKNFLVKHIIIKPNRSISLQKHEHRSEHWIVVSGTAKVECNSEEKIIHANESIFVPKGVTHRLSNPYKTDLEIIEVQTGDYIGEDDITRYEDAYGRV